MRHEALSHISADLVGESLAPTAVTSIVISEDPNDVGILQDAAQSMKVLVEVGVQCADVKCPTPPRRSLSVPEVVITEELKKLAEQYQRDCIKTEEQRKIVDNLKVERSKLTLECAELQKKKEALTAEYTKGLVEVRM